MSCNKFLSTGLSIVISSVSKYINKKNVKLKRKPLTAMYTQFHVFYAGKTDETK